MLLGLDLGTTNAKAMLLDCGGLGVLAVGSAPIAINHLPDGGVEQDIEDIWRATVKAIGQLAQAGHDLSAVRAVGVSSQGGAMQIADPAGRAIGPVISWLDARGREYDRRLTAELGSPWFASHIGHGTSGVAVGQILRLREQAPPLLDRANRVGFVGDFIVGRLTGRAAHDHTSLAICMLYNPWLKRAEPELLARLGIVEEQLPALLRAGESAGRLTASAAAATGLPAGLAVSPAVHDQYAAAIGCGAVSPGDVMFGSGTAWVLLAVSDRLAPPATQSAFVCDHPAAGRFGQMLSMVNGGSAVAWVARTLNLSAPLDEALASVVAGADGVRFRPLLAPGGGAGLAGARAGRIDGLRLAHTPGHLLRAAVEGLACELARHLQMLRAGGLTVSRLIMCGQAGESAVTPQIIADVTGVPVEIAAAGETSAFGAALIAARLADGAADLAELSLAASSSGTSLSPGKDRPIYRELFAEYMSAIG